MGAIISVPLAGSASSIWTMHPASTSIMAPVVTAEAPSESQLEIGIFVRLNQTFLSKPPGSVRRKCTPLPIIRSDAAEMLERTRIVWQAPGDRAIRAGLISSGNRIAKSKPSNMTRGVTANPFRPQRSFGLHTSVQRGRPSAEINVTIACGLVDGIPH